MCECKCNDRKETPPSMSWEKSVVGRTVDRLPYGYHAKDTRVGHRATATVSIVDGKGDIVITVSWEDVFAHGGYGVSFATEEEMMTAAAYHLIKKAWKSFLKKGY